MSYIFITIISAIFLALYDLFKKISVSEKKDIYEILFFYTLIAFLCSFVYINIAFSINFKYVLFLFLKACVISINWFLTMKAMSKLDLGVVMPFSMLGSVSTCLLAWVFFKEKIGITQISGILIIIIGLLLLAKINKKNNESKNDYKCLWLLVLAAFLSSLSAIIDKYLLISIDKGAISFWFFLFLMLLYLSVCLVKNKNINFNNLKNNLWLVGVGSCIFFADVFYYKAVGVDKASISIISIVRKLSVFIGVVFASVFLKEKYFIKKILILILMFVGLGVILFI